MPTPLWQADVQAKRFSPIENDLTVDVLVVGGGITGATTAYLLQKAGAKVALLEKGHCGQAETGHTSAHLAYVTDVRLHDLEKSFGVEAAFAVWKTGQAAIDQIERNVDELQIECGFRRVPGYLHAPWDDAGGVAIDDLRRDAELAERLGFPATFLESVPVARRPGVRLDGQAIFHPLQYLDGLLRGFVHHGGQVFEESEAEQFDEAGPVVSRGHTITCEHVVLATHVPIRGRAGKSQTDLLQTHLAAYNTYVISARLPKDAAVPSVYWDTASPYNYLRFHEADDGITAVFGGEDHKTGQVRSTDEAFHGVEERWSRMFPEAPVERRWSGQVIESNDGLPFIGEFGHKQFVAAGFAGNGLTFGTASGMLIHDAITGRENPWREFYRPDRIGLRGGVWSYVSENLDFPRYYLQDRLTPAEADSPDGVPAGGGCIVKVDGERLAIHRDADGKLHRLSAVCPHMGCLVRWNPAEQTWDCPCHGSRFTATGGVIAGPATEPLEQRSETMAGS